MSFDTCKDVWVFIESFQGQPKSVGLELLGQGRKLADGLKQKLCHCYRQGCRRSYKRIRSVRRRQDLCDPGRRV